MPQHSGLGAALSAAAGTLNLHALELASLVDDRLSKLLSSSSASGDIDIDVDGEGPPPAPPPHAVALFVVAASLLALLSLARLRRLLHAVEGRGGVVQSALDFAKSLPYVRGLVRREMASMERRLRSSLPPRPPSLLPPRSQLPARGWAAERVLEALVAAAARDGDGDGKLSGALYLPREGENEGEEAGFVVVKKGNEGNRKRTTAAAAAAAATTRKTRRSSSSSSAVVASPSPPSSSLPLSHSQLLNAAYSAFSHTNPMHSSVFPAALCLERDVVSMTASLLNGSTTTTTTASATATEGDDDGDRNFDDNSRVRGQVTSGGSESILLAVLAAREYSFKTGRCQRYGGGESRRPEVVLAASAHAAFFKAAHYLGMRVRVVRPSSASTSPSGGSRLTARDVKRHLSRNTALVVVSAPSFPHGTIDDVAGVAALASAAGIPCHVDCCLGGFVLAFSKDATELPGSSSRPSSPPPPPSSSAEGIDQDFLVRQRQRRRDLHLRAPSAFDFSVDGVTSISIDVHKFGLSHKGTSVLLFKGSGRIDGAALRRSAFVATADWPGGLYVSPGVAGSRSGALLAAAWAAMVHAGREGYSRAARAIFDQVDEFIAGIERARGDERDPLSELEVIRGGGGGNDEDDDFPLGPVVAFRARPRAPPPPPPSSSSSSSSSSSLPPLNIFSVNDVLSEEKHWHLNALQFPPALHICFTAQHEGRGARRLLEDLRWAVREVRERQRRRKLSGNDKQIGKQKGDKERGDEGMAPVYGMASASPDRGLVGEFLLTYQDVLLTG